MRNGFSLPYSPPPDQYPEFLNQLSVLKIKKTSHEIRTFYLKYTLLQKNLIRASMKLL
jgi:hypothetical protein